MLGVAPRFFRTRMKEAGVSRAVRERLCDLRCFRALFRLAREGGEVGR